MNLSSCIPVRLVSVGRTSSPYRNQIIQIEIFSTFKLPKAMMEFLLCTLFLGCRHKENIYPKIDCTPKIEKFVSLKGLSYDFNYNSPVFNHIVILHAYEQTTTSYPSPTCGKNSASTSVKMWKQTDKKNVI